MRPAALLLAGGAASRMGADRPKPLLPLDGRPLAAHILERLTPFCSPVLIGTRDEAAYEEFKLPLVGDLREGRAGPLAGLEAAGAFLDRQSPRPSHLLCAPGDTPFLPRDLVPRLCREAGELVRIATCLGRRHPSVALWPMVQLAAIGAYLDDPAGNGSIFGLLEKLGYEEVAFPADTAAPDGDPFFNINTLEDLARASTAGD